MTAPIRSLSIKQLETPTARLKLAARVKPYWFKIAPGIALGYRAGPGSWNVRVADGAGANWTKRIAHADDRELANGTTMLNYSQALDRAREMARGGDAGEASGTRPVTVREAISNYKADLIARGQSANNATQARHHLTPALLAKPVSLLTARELKGWRNSVLANGGNAATINRYCAGLKAALSLAAREDSRIGNVTAWGYGLSRLRENDVEKISEDNILDDKQRAAVIREAYAINEDLGFYCELHDATGARSSQLRLVKTRDLKHDHAGWVLTVPSSLKGKGRVTRREIPLPISTSLAQALRVYAAGRRPSDMLLQHPDGRAWNRHDLHRGWMRQVFKAAGLDPDRFTIYSLRHSAITRALLRNLPIRLVAASFDTSVAMIEATYSRFIVHRGNDQLRAALVNDEVSNGNVVQLRG